MKKVKALWLELENLNQYNSFEELLTTQNYIGFVPEGYEWRYIIVISGLCRGSSVKSEGTFSSEHSSEKGTYYTFESAKELYLWMAEGEG